MLIFILYIFLIPFLCIRISFDNISLLCLCVKMQQRWSTIYSVQPMVLSLIMIIIIIIIVSVFGSFSHRPLLEIFHWSLGDNKSPLVSRILLNILYSRWSQQCYDLDSLDSSSDSISSSLLFCRTLRGQFLTQQPQLVNTIVLMFNCYFSSLARSRYLSIVSLSFVSLCCQPGRKSQR